MLKCQLFCTFSLLYVLFLWIIYAMLLGYSLMGAAYKNRRNTLVIPSFFLRSSSVPKSVQSRCKVGGGAKDHRVWCGGTTDLHRRYFGKAYEQIIPVEKAFPLFLGIFLSLQGGILIFFSYLCKQ
jgi:hypothetical protein